MIKINIGLFQKSNFVDMYLSILPRLGYTGYLYLAMTELTRFARNIRGFPSSPLHPEPPCNDDRASDMRVNLETGRIGGQSVTSGDEMDWWTVCNKAGVTLERQTAVTAFLKRQQLRFVFLYGQRQIALTVHMKVRSYTAFYFFCME